ncbi:hypothetical protein ACH36K_10675 [Clostridium sp. MB05]|uniref:hypothetical protein n=1 Tax=Clostridium sp. MB05 TaxID=3376682 RepID=UPI0039821F23
MYCVIQKIDTLVEEIEKEYKKTDEYITHEKHRKIINKYLEHKADFEKIYGQNSYDKCYDIV